MKKLMVSFLLMTGCLAIITAQSRFPLLDKSPMDMSYYPVNYPILRIQDKANDPLIAGSLFTAGRKEMAETFLENCWNIIKYGGWAPMKLRRLNSIRTCWLMEK